VRRYAARQRDVRREQDLVAELEETSRCLGGLGVAPGGSPRQEAARRGQAGALARGPGGGAAGRPPGGRAAPPGRATQGAGGGRMGRTPAGVEKLWARALAWLRDETEEERP